MKHTALRTTLTATFTAVAAAVLLVACGGGGGGDSPTATASTPADTGAVVSTALHLSGTVTGFGSVIIDGQKFDDSAANVKIDTNPAAPDSATLSDLKLGMQVEGTVSNGTLTDVVVRASARGTVGLVNLALGTFTVFQQTVTVVTTGATPTVFDGLSGLSALAVGDVVEVHGTVDANKQIVATRVERKATGDLASGVRIGGVLVTLDAAAKTFKLGDLTVNYASATLLPAGTTLAVGQVIAVYADKAPTAGSDLVAKTVKVAGTEEGGSVGVGGPVMAYTSLSDFTVAGVRVDASAAVFETGSAADLKLGVSVAVEGKITAGVLKASKARVLKTSVDVKASLAGAVTDFVNNTSFKVRGAPVDASAAAYTGGTASDLGNGANVKVTGKIVGEMLKADTVEFTSLPPTGAITLKGEIRDLDAKTGSFHFLGVNLQLAANLVISGGTTADLANGKRVEITGTALAPPAAAPGGATATATPTLSVTKLSFLGELAPQVSVLGGRVDGLTAAGFKLPGVTINLTPNTSFSGGVLADLGNGVQVLVTGTWNAQLQAVVASSVEIRKPEDKPAGVAVAGAVSDFVSKSAFRIGQQKVDASSAVYTNGTEADLANGRAVEGSGVLAGPEGARYVLLSKLRFLK
jgi:hypothetical protein